MTKFLEKYFYKTIYLFGFTGVGITILGTYFYTPIIPIGVTLLGVMLGMLLMKNNIKDQT